MTTKYAEHVSTRKTPQSEPIPGRPEMVENSAGGFTFAVDDWTRLNRFLILGADGGSYYASERKLTQENAECVRRCLVLDPKRTVDTIVEISESGRAPKVDPAIFALAMCAAQQPYTVTGGTKAEAPGRELALNSLHRVCRTATHLFQFVEAVKAFRGMGRGLRRAIAAWYNQFESRPRDLAYQVTKYQNRNGWSHRDLLLLSHAKSASGPLNTIFRYAAGKQGIDELLGVETFVPIVAAEHAKRATDKAEIVRLIRDHALVRECIPTQFLNEPEVWDALLEKMPMTAMVRNLATMTRVGLLAPLSNAMRIVCETLRSQERITKARLHPIALLSALKTYQQGRGERSKHTWNPISQVVDALDGAFYLAFKAVEPTNKRWLLACDVSGSMRSGTIAGVPGLTPHIATGAMSIVTANVEPNYHAVAFTSTGWTDGRRRKNGITPLTISPRQRLDDVCCEMSRLSFGGTDCALPMLYALEHKIPVDAFVVYTDNETWQGEIHASQALERYRQKMGIGAKLIVVGMTATQFTIADPRDGGMFDVVGFDTAAPAVMADFVRG